MSGYGTALDIGADMHPTCRTLKSTAPGDKAARLILANAILRGLETPPGSLPDAPDYGYSLRRLILRAMSSDELDGEIGLIEAQVERDERVVSASATITQEKTSTGIAARVTIEIVPDFEGPFTFVLTATEASTEITIQ